MRRQLTRTFCLALCVLLMATVLVISPKAAVTCEHEYVDTVCTKCGKIGGECGPKLVWTFLPESGLLRITGSGVMDEFSADFPAPWTPYKPLIKEVVLGNGVSSMGPYAFSECTQLTTINITVTMANIHTSTFEKCYSLESFVLEDKPQIRYSLDEKGVLYNKDQTYLIALPGTFAGECFIPKTVKNVGPNAAGNPFRFVKGVTAIRVDENNEYFSSTEEGLLFNKEQTELIVVPRAYEGSCTVPATVTTYDSAAFTDCYSLTGFFVEEGNTAYSNTASGLLCDAEGTTVKLCPAGFTGTCVIPKEITSCPISAFTQCAGLTKFQVAEESTTFSSDAAGMLYNKAGTRLLICPNAFQGSFQVPAGVTSIAADAFKYCPGMTGFSVPTDSTQYSVDEKGILYNKSKTTLIACPATYEGSFTVPDTVTTLSAYAFYNCTGLTEVILHEGITTIGDYCFYDCQNLANIPLPDSLQTIGSHAFAHLPNQTDADIPATVTSIGTYAFACCPAITSAVIPEGITSVTGIFYQCPNLEKVTLPSTIKILGRDCFYECFALKEITVPDTVTVIGANCFWKCENLPNIPLPSGLTQIGSWAFACCHNQTDAMIPKTVTSLGDYAFAYCDALTQAAVPEGITYMAGTFRECKNLETVTLPSTIITLGSNCFYDCVNLSQINVPDTVTGIGGNCFRNCEKLPNILLPSGLTILGGAAFYDCPNQTDAMIPNTVTELGDSVFGYCESLSAASIPEGLAVIPDGIFQECTNLESVIIPDSITEIGEAAFSYCSNLVTANIPAGVTIIGDSAFNRCNQLEGLYIPAGLEELGKSAFAYCEQLTDVVIPEAITEIQSNTFMECTNLENVTLHDGITLIDNHAFYECRKLKPFAFPSQLEEIGRYAFWYCNQFEEIVIPASVKKIDECAFRYCMNLRKAVIPGTVEEVTGYTFFECPQLTEVILGEGLTEISNYMFYACNKLEKVEIPESVTRIGVNAFMHCEALKEIEIPDGVTEIAMNAFEDCKSLEYAKLPASLTTLGDEAFRETGLKRLDIPNGVTVLNLMLCANCPDLEVVSIPASVTTIIDAAFMNTGVTDVIYYGTQEAWKKLPIGAENSALKNAQVHFDPAGAYSHQFTVVEEDATCEGKGGTYRCCDCGIRKTLQTTEPIGHNYTSEVTTQPGCTQTGIRTYTCLNDPAHTYTEKVSATGHKEVPVPAVAATCTESGKTAGKRCEVCNLMLTPQIEFPALGHEWDAEATCTTSKVCTVCNEILEEAGHTYDSDFDYKCDACGETRTVDMTRPMVDMFRMYDPNSGEHFYTGSMEERENLVAVGWQYEGVGFTFPLTTGKPVHRLYDPITGEHLYTMDENEKATLLAAGWNYEGIAFNSGFENEVPQYRLHNPNASRGAYHFTASEEEMNNLIAAGWEYQGIGWYSLGA